MVAVAADQQFVTSALDALDQQVDIAAINAPRNTVITGTRKAVQEVTAALTAQGVACQTLRVSRALHAPLMDALLPQFGETAGQIDYQKPRIGLVSSVTGRLAGEEITQAQYWCRQIRRPVRFMAALETLHARGYQLFVEIGPEPILLAFGRQCIRDDHCQWLPSLRAKRSDWTQMAATLRELYLAGVPVDWRGFDRDYRRQLVTVPTYPFQRQRIVPDFHPEDPLEDAGGAGALGGPAGRLRRTFAHRLAG